MPDGRCLHTLLSKPLNANFISSFSQFLLQRFHTLMLSSSSPYPRVITLLPIFYKRGPQMWLPPRPAPPLESFLNPAFPPTPASKEEGLLTQPRLSRLRTVTLLIF